MKMTLLLAGALFFSMATFAQTPPKMDKEAIKAKREAKKAEMDAKRAAVKAKVGDQKIDVMGLPPIPALGLRGEF